MTALAIICTYNEADIIGWTVRHLKRQGCDVLVIDCQSTDGTLQIAENAGAGACTFRSNPPVSWHDLLCDVEKWAAVFAPPNPLSYDWAIHCDADEFRYSDEHDETLVEGFARVQAAGYNAIDHKVVTFHPTCGDGSRKCGKYQCSHGFDGTQDPEQYFRYYSPYDALNQRNGQVKAWRNLGPVSLANSAGHQAQFPHRRIYPRMFLSKHYPIRSQAHGERKVFQERKWLDEAQGRKQWHVQYQGITPGYSFLKDPKSLLEWKGQQ